MSLILENGLCSSFVLGSRSLLDIYSVLITQNGAQHEVEYTVLVKVGIGNAKL